MHGRDKVRQVQLYGLLIYIILECPLFSLIQQSQGKVIFQDGHNNNYYNNNISIYYIFFKKKPFIFIDFIHFFAVNMLC